LKYGALNHHVTKVFCTEGKIDFWSELGIAPPNDTRQMKSIYIEGASHCADLSPFRYGESPNLTDARIQGLTQIVSWMNEENESSEGNGDSRKEGNYFGTVISPIILVILLVISVVIIIKLCIKSKNSSNFAEI
jgi:hypothetical protein